jgi:hypothetical protein
VTDESRHGLQIPRPSAGVFCLVAPVVAVGVDVVAAEDVVVVFADDGDGALPSADGARPFMPTVYSARTQMPISVWQQHFANPQHSVDILVLAATFLFDTLDGFVDTLVEAAGRGVGVRLLVGDPDGPSLTLRGEEEGIGEAVVARCRTTVELLAPRASTPGLQIRTHQTTLYASLFRVDDRIIVNFHIYGSPGRSNPVMVFARTDEPRLWATFEQAFDRVWDNAKPLNDRGHSFP